MLRLLIGGIVLACGAMQASAQGGTRPDSARALPMHFEWRQHGPAEACGKTCLTWISAVGVITADTPREFARFIQGRDIRGATIVLDSDGGSVHGALALGRAIRAHKMTTAVGKTIVLPPDSSGAVRARLSPRADCESMCAFVLLAGTRRYVPPEANVRVHQIWLGDRRDDATAASYSAEDMVLVQRDIGRLAQYTVEMDGSVDLLEMALRIPPWEPMRRLSSEEQRRMRLNNLDALFERSPSDAVTTSLSSVPTPTGVRKTSAMGERGWFTVERAGQQTLARRHPLTLDGEDIGSFELTFACSESADTYAVTYAERRRLKPEAAEQLKKVTITLGGKTSVLDVTSSEPSSNQLASQARGTVPASLVKYLAENGNRSVTVATTSNSGGTVIRVGNSGVAQHYARLASACGKLARARAALMSSGAGRIAEPAR